MVMVDTSCFLGVLTVYEFRCIGWNGQVDALVGILAGCTHYRLLPTGCLALVGFEARVTADCDMFAHPVSCNSNRPPKAAAVIKR